MSTEKKPEWEEEFEKMFVPNVKIGEATLKDWFCTLKGTTANYNTLYSFIKQIEKKAEERGAVEGRTEMGLGCDECNRCEEHNNYY